MGASIAYVTAAAGIDVILIDRDMDAANKGKATGEGLVKESIGKGRLTQEEGAAILSRITPSADYADLKDANLVIEAVFEDREVKKDVIEAVEEVLPEGAIFASNTSTLPITGLAKNSKRPENFIGIHFFSPVEKMMLTEVILGKETGDNTLAVALDYVAAIKKTPIVVNDTRGFFVNRCVLRYMAESYDMLIEGVPPAMIENAAKMAGMPVGPLALNDEVAIDLSLKILKATVADLGEKAIAPATWSSSPAWWKRKAASAARTPRASTITLRSPPRSPSGPNSSPSTRRRRQRAWTSTPSSSASWSPSRSKPPARSKKASSPTPAKPTSAPSSLRLRAVYWRRAQLHRRHGRQKVRGIVRNVSRFLRIAFQADVAAEGHGREGRDVLWPV
ncbi:hypothetical protein AJ87_05605 [Rhizobium yanglingense]|nr:hypothetical protein AJ87_05605 [Rhizobium yanglingense]